METYWKHDCSFEASGYPEFKTRKDRRNIRRNQRRGEEMKEEVWKEKKEENKNETLRERRSLNLSPPLRLQIL